MCGVALSKKLIAEDYNIISGFGLGVGSAVITGALEEIYMHRNTINDDRLLLRPFPQGIEDESKRRELWNKYREDMISRAGITIFIFGNKVENNKIVTANGMLSEFKIAQEKHNILVPIGCTGYAAQEIWNEIKKEPSKYYNNVDEMLMAAFDKLNIMSDDEELIGNILAFINLFKDGKYSSI